MTGRLATVSVVHSTIYAALLIAAFGLGGPQPETFILGLTHGVLWIGMSLACLVALRRGLLPLRVALAVVVLGGIAPFFGTFEFIRLRRAQT